MTALHFSQQNQLLAALSPTEVRRRNLQLITLPLGKVLHEPGQAQPYIFFPVDCIVSLLCVLNDGDSAEFSVVGNDGLVGIAAFMGGQSTPSQAVVQSAGRAYQMAGYHLREIFRTDEAMQALLLRYAQALITQMAQTAICNRHHTIDQQLCRWLLLSLDRLATNQLVMTQELIANMLGIRRDGVSTAAANLDKLGIIRYSNGKITVLDRLNLEHMCCECYSVVKRETNRLCPAPYRDHNAVPVAGTGP
jgi:CRP-like cAMP-binding protein